MIAASLFLLAFQAPPAWLERVYSAPPEIAAHLLLKRPDRIEDAFRLAAQARLPYPELTQGANDTLAGMRLQASLLHLDALGLQVRAIQATMRKNPGRALQMALELPIPSPPRTSCESASVPSLDEYYGLVLHMARLGFPAQAREDNRHLDFMLRAVSAANSPEMLQGAAALVRLYEGPEKETSALVTALSAALRTTPASPRAHLLTPSLKEEVEAVIARTQSEALNQSWQAYLNTQQDAKPCGASQNYIFWESGESRELHQDLAALRRSAAPEDPEWQAQFIALLHRIESWQPDPETPPLAHFHMKALAYRALLDTTEKPDLMRPAISSLVAFLNAAPAKTDAPADWMVHFRRMVIPWAPGGMAAVEIARSEIRRLGDAVSNLLADAGDTF